LEKIADHYKYVCEHVVQTRPKPLQPMTLKLFRLTNQFFEEYANWFYAFDMKKSDELMRKFEQVQALGERSFKHAGAHEEDIIYNLLSVSQLTYNLIGILIALKV
jgi:hypothetical protein